MAAAIPFIPYIAAAVSAAGSIGQANSASSAAKYNAAVQEQAAETTRAQATIQQEAQREKARQTIGRQLAEVSSSGTSLTGSNLNSLSDSLYNAELDSLNIRYESELNARGLEADAALSRSKGDSSQMAGILNAASALTSAGGSYLNRGSSVPKKAGS